MSKYSFILGEDVPYPKLFNHDGIPYHENDLNNLNTYFWFTINEWLLARKIKSQKDTQR